MVHYFLQLKRDILKCLLVYIGFNLNCLLVYRYIFFRVICKNLQNYKWVGAERGDIRFPLKTPSSFI